jgi:alkaline phosphatase D
MKSLVVVILFTLAITSCTKKTEFTANFDNTHDRIWLGADFWSVPLEDWKVKNGRMECIGTLSNSRVNILTHRLNGSGNLDVRFRFGMLEDGSVPGKTGIRLAMTDHTDNSYKSLCYHGQGIDVGVQTNGKLFINDEATDLPSGFDYSSMTMNIQAVSSENEKELKVAITDMNGLESEIISTKIENLEGMIAFVNYFSQGRMNEIDAPKFWFDDIKMSGSMVEATPDNAFGPILFSMYTLSKGTMKMSAQMPPLGIDDNKTVKLQLLKNGTWQDVSESEINEMAWLAEFKIEDWNDKIDHDYRLVYTENYKDGSSKTTYRDGVVRKDPVDKSLEVAGFTCQFDYGFPYTPLVDNVNRLNPDLLYFSGDQLYETNGGYDIIRFPADRAILNYLGKWYMFGWAFGDLMKDRPTITITDDHDIYQGNIWGAGGETVSEEEWEEDKDARSGYVQPVDMIKVVMQTQSAHLPDSPGLKPMDNEIPVYYSDLLYGNVSFAIIADRAFKSGPEEISWWDGRLDHIKFPVEAEKLDDPRLKLLGESQLEFLNGWAEDWENAEFKCLLSQTIFANSATHHGANKMFLYGDMDSGGWPKSARDIAVMTIRKAGAFHICGDQHLPSFAQYGIDDYRQAGWVFCTPAITTGYERRFLPEEVDIPIQNSPNHNLPNTGEFTDVFGNPHYVYAVGNPEDNTSYPNRYRQAVSRSSGFGMTIFDPKTGDIRNEAYIFDAEFG